MFQRRADLGRLTNLYLARYNCRPGCGNLGSMFGSTFPLLAKLPIGDGSRVFRLVRQANPQARTVVITGHRSEMDEMVRRVLDEGADAVCYKPFDVSGLLATLQKLTA